MTPPRLARWILRLVPLRERRSEAEADLGELFDARVRAHGRGLASRRYYGDVLSLFFRAGPSLLDGLGGDLVFARRMFGRRPALVALTVIGLALGIGVSTAVFTLMNAALLRSNGIVEPSRVVNVLRLASQSTSTVWPYSEYLDLRQGVRSAVVEGWMSDAAPVGEPSAEGKDAPSIRVAFVSGGYLRSMGARAALGRMLEPSDDAAAAPPVIVINHGFWTGRFGGDPAVLGRVVRVGRTQVTIVGVAAPTFTAPSEATMAWAPVGAYHLVYRGGPLGHGSDAPIYVVGRIAPGFSSKQAEAEMSGVAAALPLNGPAERRPTGVLTDGIGFRSSLYRLQVVAVVGGISTVIGLLLLLACVNVANLLLAMALTRDREIGMRLALGAGRGRIVRQLLTESLALASAGGALGLLVATWLVPYIVRVTRAPEGMNPAIDMNVYLFLAAITTLAGLGAGLAPARYGLRGDLMAPLKGQNAGTVAHRPQRSRRVLIAIQSAGSVLLLVLSILLVRATLQAVKVDVGFDTARMYAVSVEFPRGRATPQKTYVHALWTNTLERLRSLPDIESATLMTFAPFSGLQEIRTLSRNASQYRVWTFRTTADYFDMIGVKVLRGRAYTPQEVASGADVVLISETLARDLWPGEDPVGSALSRVDKESKATIVGVVSDAMMAHLRDRSAPAVYRPLSPEHETLASVLVRARPGAANVDGQVRSVMQQLDGEVTVRTTSVAERLQMELDEPRLLAAAASALAILAVLLAVIGLYGVTAAAVGQRTREIGVRLAIGAERRDVMRQLMLESLRPVFTGLAVGLVLAVLGARVIAGVLFGVPAYDPVSLVAAVVVLVAASAGAVAVPVNRASRVDPAFVLRQS